MSATWDFENGQPGQLSVLRLEPVTGPDDGLYVRPVGQPVYLPTVEDCENWIVERDNHGEVWIMQGDY